MILRSPCVKQRQAGNMSKRQNGRVIRGDREHTRLQRALKENEKLKRQISKLRKVIARIDLDRYENLRDIILQQENVKADTEPKKAELERWKCFECNDGVLRLKVFENRAGIRYYRKCDNCSNRTKAQNYTKDVEGIK